MGSLNCTHCKYMYRDKKKDVWICKKQDEIIPSRFLQILWKLCKYFEVN